MSADRNLLYGILALQLNFASRDQLVEAMAAWVLDKTKGLGEIFVAQKVMEARQHELLDALVNNHVEKHNDDVAQSLQQLSSVDHHTKQLLEQIQDSDLGASLQRVSPVKVDPYKTEAKVSSPASSTSRFRIIRPHARGGLGEVFVANDTELSREVALKEIQGQHAESLESRQRFLREAEITGNLEHPGIVPVYGLGHYQDGRPFYAMRFIRGENLKEAIDAFHARYKSKLNEGAALLELRQLLRRLIDVCNAIAYAHSRGVLHRDLKPGNIILGKYGETLVVDWGLAKANGDPDALSKGSIGPVMPVSGSGLTPTMEGSMIGTPAYMSPEQANGRLNALSGATDVYSLGATLFHLLTGQLPIEGRSAFELITKAQKGEVRRLRDLRSDLPHSLEAVCLKAMARSPEDRYGSPSEMAADLDRWLADEPVSAYVEPWSIRARRWVRRHPALVSTTAACVVLGLCATMLLAYLQGTHARELTGKNVELTKAKEKAEDKQQLAERERNRAEQREQEAIDAVKRFGDAVANNKELKDNPKLDTLRRELLKEPLSFFKSLRQRLQAEPHTRPESLSQLASAAYDLGRLTDEIGDKQDALVAYREALTINERLARENPAIDKYASILANSHLNIGLLLNNTGKPTEALAAYEQSKAIHERLAKEHPNVAKYANDLALSHNNIGILLKANGKPTDALAAYELARAIQKRLAQENPSVNEYASNLAVSHNNIGVVLRETGRPDEALAACAQGLAIRKRLVQENPNVTSYKRELAASYIDLGSILHDTGKPDEALAACEQARAIQESLVQTHPSVTRYASELGASNNNIGALLREAGKLDEALVAFEQCRTIQERLARENPTFTRYASDLASSHNNIGTLLHETGRPDEALAAYKQAQATYERLAQENPAITDYQSLLGMVQSNIGNLLIDERQFSQARAALEMAIEYQSLALTTNPNHTSYRQHMANHLFNLLIVAEAIQDNDLAQKTRLGLRELAASDPKFASLDGRMTKVLEGEVVKSTQELLAFAQRSYDLQQFGRATRFYGDALQREAALVEDRQGQVAYNAACSAALASSGLTEDDPKPDEVERARLRGKSLEWLKSELAQWKKFLETADPQQRAHVATILKHWQNDTDLKSVRNEAALTELPDSERADWQSHWAKVAELIIIAEADN